MVLKLVVKNGAYITPWGHRFGTEKEFYAFVEGMKYMAGNVVNHADMLLEKVTYTKQVTDDQQG